MTADLLVRVNLDLLYPPFLERLLSMLHALRCRGLDFYAISGFRTYTEQNKLYFQGRTSPGGVVTNARGGQSAHNFGIAVDLSLDKDATRAGLQPSWDPKLYGPLGEEARRAELTWGGGWKFKDIPHVQVPLFITAQDMKPLRLAFESVNGVDSLPKLREAWKIANDELDWLSN